MIDNDSHAPKHTFSTCQYLLSKDTERVQKRCLKLLYPYFSYNEALNKSDLDHLDYRRDLITENLFSEIKDPKHPLHYLLPPVKVSHSQMVLRHTAST